MTALDPVRVEAAKKWAEKLIALSEPGIASSRHIRVLLDALEAAEAEPSRRSWQAMELNLREALRARDKASRDLSAALDALSPFCIALDHYVGDGDYFRCQPGYDEAVERVKAALEPSA